MSDYETLKLQTDDGVAHLVLSRPDQRNSMTEAFWEEFPAALQAIDRDGHTRVVVISAAGKHFCSGMDLGVFASIAGAKDIETGRRRANLRERILKFQAALTTIEQIRPPVIAAIQGACIGGGAALASACDMRYCSSDAFFSIEETNIGITCDVGTLQRLRHVLAQTHLREWVYTGARLAADKAAAWGLVGEVFPDQDALLEGVMQIARTIAGKSPLVMHGCKLEMNYDRDHSVREGLENIALWNAAVLQESEVSEAMTARAKQQPGDFPPLTPRVEIKSGV